MWRNWQTRKIQVLVGDHAGSSPVIRTMLGRQKRYLALKPRCQRGFRHLKGLEIHVHFRRYKIGILPL